MPRTKKSAPSAPTADKLEEKLALRAAKLGQELMLLADQLPRELLKLKPLLKILKAVGVDPASTDAWRLAGLMHVALFHGISKIGISKIQRRPRRAIPNAATWTRDHDIALMLEVVDLKRQDISEREAIKQIAKKPRNNHPSLAHRFPYKPQTGLSEAGRGHSQSTDQARYEETLRQRWKKIKQDEKAQTIVALPDELLIALGFSPTSVGKIEK
jgi:hypothetical protein